MILVVLPQRYTGNLEVRLYGNQRSGNEEAAGKSLILLRLYLPCRCMTVRIGDLCLISRHKDRRIHRTYMTEHSFEYILTGFYPVLPRKACTS